MPWAEWRLTGTYVTDTYIFTCVRLLVNWLTKLTLQIWDWEWFSAQDRSHQLLVQIQINRHIQEMILTFFNIVRWGILQCIWYFLRAAWMYLGSWYLWVRTIWFWSEIWWALIMVAVMGYGYGLNHKVYLQDCQFDIWLSLARTEIKRTIWPWQRYALYNCHSSSAWNYNLISNYFFM